MLQGKTLDRIVLNSFFLMSQSIFLILSGIFFQLILVKFFLPDVYGIMSTVIKTASMLTILATFGFNYALIKNVPQYLERKENGKISALFNFSLKFVIVTSIIIGAVLLLFLGEFTKILNLPKQTILFAALSVIPISVSSMFVTMLIGFQNMKWVALLRVIGNVGKLVVAVVFLLLGFGYFAPLLGFVASYIIILFIALKLVPIKSTITKINVKKIFIDYSLPAFLSIIIGAVFFSGRYLLLNGISGAFATGIFSLGITLTTPLTLLPSVILQVMFPMGAQLATKAKTKKTLSEIISYYIKIVLLLTLPIAIVLSIFSKQIILLYSRAEYIPAAQLFPILALMSVIYSIGGMLHQTLYSIGQTKIYRNIIAFSVLLFLIFSVPLAFKFSTLGMAYSTLIFALIYTFLSFIKLRKFIEISLPIKNILKIILSAGMFTVILYFLSLVHETLIWSAISIFITAPIYLLLLFMLKTFEKNDADLIRTIGNRTPFLKKYIIYIASKI